MVAPTTTPTPSIPEAPAPNPLIAAILSPNTPLDPYQLAELLKDPAAVAALEAHEAIENLRLRLQVTAVAAKAVARLDILLNTSEDPVEVRRIASILERFQSRGRAKAASLRDAAGAPSDPESDPQDDPDDILDDEPDPLDDPLKNGAGIPPKLPCPQPQATPEATVALQLQALSYTPRASDITKVLGHIVVNKYKKDLDLFLPGLLRSPAWTHRQWTYIPGEPIIQGDQASIRVTYQDAPVGSNAPGPQFFCTFRLQRELNYWTRAPYWNTHSITTENSG